MDPSIGVNAGLYLIHFLNTLNLNQSAQSWTAFGEKYLFDSHFGEKMGMKFHSDSMGDLTTNIGVIRYDLDEGGSFGINLRYPEGFDFDRAISDFTAEIQALGFDIEGLKVQTPHFVNPEDPFVQNYSQLIATKQETCAHHLRLAEGRMPVI